MTAASHTLYSLSLFFALVALNLWTARRHRFHPIQPTGSAASSNAPAFVSRFR